MSEQWIIRDIPIAKLYPFLKLVISPGVGNYMKASIIRHGLLEPLTVFPEADDRFSILDGHVRYAALKELHYETVPCRLRDSALDDRKTNKNHKSSREDE